MRADTLAAAEVVGTLDSHFIIAWHNLLPELYGKASPTAAAPPRYTPENVRAVPEGSGGGNIRVYFCTPQGRVVHETIGYWKQHAFLGEVRVALDLLSQSRDQAERFHRERQRALTGQQEAALAALASQPERNDPEVRRAALLGLRLRAAAAIRQDLYVDVEVLMDRRREEVYTKGAVGCDH